MKARKKQIKKKSYRKGGIFPPKIQQMKNNLDPVIYDGVLDEVTVTPTTASEYAWRENRANQSTGGLTPVYPIFDLMSSGARAPLTKGAKALQNALRSEKALGALAKSPYVPKFAKPSLIKKYKSNFPKITD